MCFLRRQTCVASSMEIMVCGYFSRLLSMHADQSDKRDLWSATATTGALPVQIPELSLPAATALRRNARIYLPAALPRMGWQAVMRNARLMNKLQNGTCAEIAESQFLLLRLTDGGSHRSELAWCATNSFPGGSYIFYCHSSAYIDGDVIYIEKPLDWYATARGVRVSGSNVDPKLTQPSGPIDALTKSSTVTASPSSLTVSTASDGTIVIVTSTPAHRGLSGAAIGGITAGVGALILAIVLGIIAAIYFRRRPLKTGGFMSPSAAAGVSSGTGTFRQTSELNESLSTNLNSLNSPNSPYSPNPVSPSAQEVPVTHPATEPWEMPISPTTHEVQWWSWFWGCLCCITGKPGRGILGSGGNGSSQVIASAYISHRNRLFTLRYVISTVAESCKIPSSFSS